MANSWVCGGTRFPLRFFKQRTYQQAACHIQRAIIVNAITRPLNPVHDLGYLLMDFPNLRLKVGELIIGHNHYRLVWYSMNIDIHEFVPMLVESCLSAFISVGG